MSREERSDGPKNIVVMVLAIAFAFLVNPFVKLWDWLRGESE